MTSAAEWQQPRDDFDTALRQGGVDYAARSSMLYRRPDYIQRREMAHDLRNGGAFSMDFLHFKRDYQWAVDAWLLGRLTAVEFHARGAAFDRACRIASVAYERSRYRNDLEATDYWNMPSTKALLRTIRRLNREGFVAAASWRSLHMRRRIEETWQQQRQAQRQVREATAVQRRALKEGHATLTAIRRVLRGQDPSPQLASTLAKTSPTL